jgi:hypothetical protein
MVVQSDVSAIKHSSQIKPFVWANRTRGFIQTDDVAFISDSCCCCCVSEDRELLRWCVCAYAILGMGAVVAEEPLGLLELDGNGSSELIELVSTNGRGGFGEIRPRDDRRRSESPQDDLRLVSKLRLS